MTKEEQGAEERGEDVWSDAVERLADGEGDGDGAQSGGGRAFCQCSGDLSCIECGAVCEGAEDGREGPGGLRREKVME